MERDLLKEAVVKLANRCDYANSHDAQGFNAADTVFGHSLAAQDRWSPKQARAAWKMVKKYHAQLASLGINYNEIPEPPDPATLPAIDWRVTDDKPARPKVPNTIEFDGRNFVIKFEYDSALVAKVKEIPGRRWDSVKKCWTVSPKQDMVQALSSFAKDNGFSIDKASGNKLEEIDSHARELSRTAEWAKEASRATDAEIEVRGLGGTLRPFQKAGVAYASRQKRCFIADEMGLGKTIQALATLQHLDSFPALIIVPASVKLNWAREVEKWLPGKSVVVLNGSNGTFDTSHDIVIINYDILTKHCESLKRRHFKALIMDESTYCKNPKTIRAKTVKELSKTITVILALTGTPILNRPQELISQLEILDRLDDMGGFWTFAKRYCDAKRGQWGWDMSGSSNLGELNDKLRSICYIRRIKSEVLKELPPVQHATIPMTIDNWEEYNGAENDLVSWLHEKKRCDEKVLKIVAKIAEENPGMSKQKRQEILEQTVEYAVWKAMRGETFVRIGALKQIAAKGKIESVKSWVSDFMESDQKLIIFAHHIEIQKSLLKEFPGSARLFGEDSPVIRQQNIDRFQNNPSCRIIVCSLIAGGIGVTLTAASNVAFVEFGWNPGTMDQAKDRAHRIGQEHKVTAWWLIADGTIDNDIVDLIAKKREVVDAATDGSLSQEDDESVMNGVIDRLLRKGD